MSARAIATGSAALLLAGALALLARGLGWPPPRLVLVYGLPPAGGPTGRTTRLAGMEFVELGPGYVRAGTHAFCAPGDVLGRLCAGFGLPFGRRPSHFGWVCVPHRVEVRRPVWVARRKAAAPLGGPEEFLLLTWREALAHCARLGDEHPPWRFRPLTEDEWEYAARAGDPAPSETALAAIAGPGSSALANAWGIAGMRAWPGEWCSGREPAHPIVIRGPFETPAGFRRLPCYWGRGPAEDFDRRPNVPGIGVAALRLAAE